MSATGNLSRLLVAACFVQQFPACTFTCLLLLVQKSEEASKQYKKWLKAMAEYSRALLGAKAAVQAAEEEAKGREEDLTLFLEQAETFLLARDKHRRRRADKEKEA